MADDTRHAAVVESLKATASELHARPPEEMNQDWADRMAEALGAAGLLAASTKLPDDVAEALAEVQRSHDFDCGSAPYQPEVLHFARAAERLAEYIQRRPAAPADDEATIERMARASWYASDGFITGLPWPVTGFRAEKERRRVRGALAAYLGQPWYVGQEIEWNPTGDEWKTGFITRLSGDNAGITLHDNAQPLTVSTRNLRSALAALREGQ